MQTSVTCLVPLGDHPSERVNRPVNIWSVYTGQVQSFEDDPRSYWSQLTLFFQLSRKNLMVIYAGCADLPERCLIFTRQL